MSSVLYTAPTCVQYSHAGAASHLSSGTVLGLHSPPHRHIHRHLSNAPSPPRDIGVWALLCSSDKPPAHGCPLVGTVTSISTTQKLTNIRD